MRSTQLKQEVFPAGQLILGSVAHKLTTSEEVARRAIASSAVLSMQRLWVSFCYEMREYIETAITHAKYTERGNRFAILDAESTSWKLIERIAAKRQVPILRYVLERWTVPRVHKNLWLLQEFQRVELMHRFHAVMADEASWRVRLRHRYCVWSAAARCSKDKLVEITLTTAAAATLQATVAVPDRRAAVSLTLHQCRREIEMMWGERAVTMVRRPRPETAEQLKAEISSLDLYVERVLFALVLPSQERFDIDVAKRMQLQVERARGQVALKTNTFETAFQSERLRFEWEEEIAFKAIHDRFSALMMNYRRRVPWDQVFLAS